MLLFGNDAVERGATSQRLPVYKEARKGPVLAKSRRADAQFCPKTSHSSRYFTYNAQVFHHLLL